MAKKLYYMHPINTYGSELERQQLRTITQLFPEWEVVNPNAPEHEAAYRRLSAETGNGMPYFTELASRCQGGVALPFGDGKFGAGIYAEAIQLVAYRCPVWVLSRDGTLSRFDAAAEHLRLSVEETRKRIRHEDGSTRAYE